MTTQSFIAVEVLQGLFNFRCRLSGCWGPAARSMTSFDASNFPQDLIKIGMAYYSRVVEKQGHAECTASSYRSVDRVIRYESEL